MAEKQNNPGAKSLKKHFSDLSEAVQHPLGLAANLYSADIIDKSILEQIAESSKTKQEKNVLLLNAVSSQVSQKPEVFERFLEILKKDSYLDHITKMMALEASTSQNNQPSTSFGTGREPLRSQKRDISLKWKAGPALPHGKRMSRGAAAVHGANVYFNSAQSSTIYKYCSKTNKWLNEIESPRTDFGLEVVKGFLTLIGGKMTKAISESGEDSSEEVTNTLLSLPLGEKGHLDWSETFPSMPTKRTEPETACIGQYVAVVGGKEETKSSVHLNRVEVMDTGVLQWHVCDNIPNISGISWMTMAASDDTLYVSGQSHDRYFLCTCSMQALLQSKQGAIKAYTWQELQRPHVCTTDCTYTLTTLNGQLMAAGCEHIKVVTVKEDDDAREFYEWEQESKEENDPYGYDYDDLDDDDPPDDCYVYIYNSNSWIQLSNSVHELQPHSPLFVAVSGNKLILVGNSFMYNNPYVRYTNVAMN